MKDFSVKIRIINIIFEKKKILCYLFYINIKGFNLKISYEFYMIISIMNFFVVFIMYRILYIDFY